MATRTSRYRSQSPTGLSPTHSAYDQTKPSPLMALDSRGTAEQGYGGRGDVTLPPFSRSLVVGTGSPIPPRNPVYNSGIPLSPPRETNGYNREMRPAPIPEHGPLHDRPRYSYDESYSEFSQTKPPLDPVDPEIANHLYLPPISSAYVNGPSSISLPPIHSSAYQNLPATNGLDAYRQRQLSINSIISSPGISSPPPTYNSYSAVVHGNGTLKKRKKSFGAESEGEEDNIDSDDRDRDGIRTIIGDAGSGGGHHGMNGVHHKTTSSVELGVRLEDPDVRLAAEALGDLRAGRLRLSYYDAPFQRA